MAGLQKLELSSSTVAVGVLPSTHICNTKNAGYYGDIDVSSTDLGMVLEELHEEMEFWDVLSDDAFELGCL